MESWLSGSWPARNYENTSMTSNTSNTWMHLDALGLVMNVNYFMSW